MKKLPKFSSENKKLKIHFIGIGEIEDFALAQYFLNKGHQVSRSGSDFKDLRKLSKNYDLVIYNSRLIKSRLPNFLSYEKALGKLTKEYFTIAVSGSHGKSTTAAMIGLILAKAGFDPTVLVGAKVKEFGDSRCRIGKSQYLVIEIGEQSDSLLNCCPRIIVVTNIEKHLSNYYNNTIKVFKKFVNHLPKNRILIINKSLNNIILPIGRNILYFSLEQKEVENLKRILKIPGEHNIYNALAALSVVRALKIPDKISFQVFSEHKGCRRRFEIKRIRQGIIIDDYAHYPIQIKLILRTVREKWPKKEIWCIFQFPQNQEIGPFFNDLVVTLKEAPVDKIIITDLYDFYEKGNINSKKLVQSINKSKTRYIPRNKAINYLKNNFPMKGIVVIMGNRDIYLSRKPMSFLTKYTK